MEGKVDRRVLKTRERLHSVFIQLLAEKPLKSITVKELSEKADINRATFYLHYKDVFDLFEKMEQDVLHEFEQICASLRTDFTDEEFIAVFMQLLNFIRDNRSMCDVLFGAHGDRGFFERMIKIITEKCYDAEKYSSYGFSFAIAGIVGIILRWTSTDMKEPDETVAMYALTMINKIRA